MADLFSLGGYSPFTVTTGGFGSAGTVGGTQTSPFAVATPQAAGSGSDLGITGDLSRPSLFMNASWGGCLDCTA